MKTFKQFVLEMAQAKAGDYREGSHSINPLPPDYLFSHFKKLDIIDSGGKKFLLYQRTKDNINNYTDFVLGYFDKTKNNFFIPIFALTLEDQKGLLPEYPKLKVVKSVFVRDENQKSGIAISLYKYLVEKLGFEIMGDSQQYFGARKLWSKLSKDVDFQVDIIDLKEKEVLDYGVKVHQGLEDSDFDKRIWSYEPDKKHIRLILTKMF